MKKLFGVVLLTVFGLAALPVKADEGMWLPLLIKRLNYADMQKKGLKLTAEEIYSVNNASLKDAIVSLGGFCTGEMISSKGLMLTNHHCAFDAIQSHSTTDHNYLKDGFWAMSNDEELAVPGLFAKFLVRMEDVTEEVLGKIAKDATDVERATAIAEQMERLKEEYSKDNDYDITVRSFFEGNEYYLFVYEVYNDVRLVGAPPSSIGKFGGDTDNWMWPRHTGDFAMLRVYAGADNSPANYSADNVPFTPKHHLPVSMKGVQANDFAMVMGYPGSTDRFLSSYGVNLAISIDQPERVRVRERKLALMKEDMLADEAVDIQYASKYAQVSNYYKYFIGQTRGLKRLKVYDKKKSEEDAFAAWVAEDEERKETYKNVLKDMESSYKTLEKYKMSMVHINETVFGIDVHPFVWGMNRRMGLQNVGKGDMELWNESKEALTARATNFFDDFNASTDQKVMAAMLEMYAESVPQDQQPESFKALAKKCKGNWDKYAEKAFAKSVFTDRARFMNFIENPSAKVLAKDPIYNQLVEFVKIYRSEVIANTGAANEVLGKAKRLYIQGLRQMNPDKAYAPDANSTMRLTYGNVGDYYPKDGVHYLHYTTLEGIIAKEDASNPEFVVPAKLKELYVAKDYGQYGMDGKMPVCFITNNDITGGNSGSPVINGDGELIGCAFDGNWEAMSGDIAFETQMQRTIAVDIRYVLFVVDKLAGCSRLVDEMTLAKEEAKPAGAPMGIIQQPAGTGQN